MSVILRLPGGGSGGGGEGGGPNGNSIILADNTTISTYSYDNKITVKWNPPPNTEMPIDHYVLYWKKTNTAPTSIDQYDDYIELSAGTREYSLTGLTNNDQYFFFLESVGTNEFGNASLRAQKTESVGIPLWVMFYVAISSFSDESSTYKVSAIATSNDFENFTFVQANNMETSISNYFSPQAQGDFVFTSNGWFYCRANYSSYYAGEYNNLYDNIFIVKNYDFSKLSDIYNPDIRIYQDHAGLEWVHCKNKMILIKNVNNVNDDDTNIYFINDGETSLILKQTISGLGRPYSTYTRSAITYIPEKNRVLFTLYKYDYSDYATKSVFTNVTSTDGGETFTVTTLPSTYGAMPSNINRPCFWWKDRYYSHNDLKYSFDGNNWVNYSIVDGERVATIVNTGKYLYAFVYTTSQPYNVGVRITSDGVHWGNFILLHENLNVNTSFGFSIEIYAFQSSFKNNFGLYTLSYMYAYNEYTHQNYRFPLDGSISGETIKHLYYNLNFTITNPNFNRYIVPASGLYKAVVNTVV